MRSILLLLRPLSFAELFVVVVVDDGFGFVVVVVGVVVVVVDIGLVDFCEACCCWCSDNFLGFFDDFDSVLQAVVCPPLVTCTTTLSFGLSSVIQGISEV